MTRHIQAYTNLINHIDVTLKKGLIAAQKALEYERLKTYWHIGQAIVKAEASGEIELGASFYQQASRDIEIKSGVSLSPDRLSRIVSFGRDYSRCPRQSSLSFTHYEILGRIQDKRQRMLLEKRAAANTMNVEALKDEIRRMQLALIKPSSYSSKLICRRGEPYIYRTLQRPSLDGGGDMRVDCGFYISVAMGGRIRASSAAVTSKARVVQVVKNARTYTVMTSKKRIEACYTYLARVLRVVDGDTLDVVIDVGFGIELAERIRLKRINAPEKDSTEGLLAMQYLKDLFRKNSWIVIRSEREGVYKRWIADVFIHDKSCDPYVIASEGVFLNQQLLDDGLAVKM